MSKVEGAGNSATRNWIAKKHNLKMSYQSYPLMKELGIKLFQNKIYKNTKI